MNRRRALEDASEAVEHSAGAAEDWRAEVGIGFIKPCGEADASGDSVQFGDGEAILGEEEVRTYDARQVIFESGVTLQFDQVLGFALIQPLGDPGGLFAFETMAVEEINRAVELEQDAAELIDLPGNVRGNGKGIRCNAPGVILEEPLRRESTADKVCAFGWKGGNVVGVIHG